MHSVLMSKTKFYLALSTYFLFKNVTQAEKGKTVPADGKWGREVSHTAEMERHSGLPWRENLRRKS